MSQGRITCPRCGSNNFDTVTVCWKCGNPLSAAAAAQAAPAPPRAGATMYAAPAVQPVPAAAQPMAQPSFGDRAAATFVSTANTLGNAAAANRAAFWLGILMPYFGLPIGLAFIMCDDRRRQEVGRLCVLWSIVSGVLHFLLMFVAMLGMRQMFSAFLGSAMTGLRNGGGGMGGGGMGGGMGDGP